jgi:uncharacterized protein YjbI with pentapeptide repeats
VKLVNATPFPFAALPGKIRPPDWSATVVVKTSFALVPGGPAAPMPEPLPFMGDVYRDEEASNDCFYDSDFAPLKPHADILLVGTCHAPDGKPTTACRIEFGVGGWSKALAVIGNRHWKKSLLMSSASDPEPFTAMPVNFANAYGGDGFAKNPVGRGYEKAYLPNIEPLEDRIASPGERPDPAGFGPINRAWPQRASKTGSYRGKYMKERWPNLPDDFDFTYFNAAPEDQQFRRYPRGDEELRFENLHPKQANYRSALPGLRIRCFLSEKVKDGKRFREVPMNLDTLFVDMDKETLVLVWRGTAHVQSEELTEIEHALCVSELLKDAPAPAASYEALIPKPVPAPAAPAAAAPAADKSPPPWVVQAEAVAAQAKKAQAAAVEELKAQAKPLGIEIDALLARPPAGLEEAPAALAAAKASLTALGAVFPASLDAQIAALATGGEIDALVKKAIVAHLPPPPKPPVSPELLKEKAAKAGGLKGQDLSGAKLGGADLSELDLGGVILRGADLSKAKLVKTNLKGAQLSGADLTGADLTEANLEKADLTKATLAGATFTGANLTLADFSDTIAPKAVFSGATGSKTILSRSNLEGALFEKAKLPNADFSQSILTGAKFGGAALLQASLAGVKAGGADFSEADLTKIDGSEAADFKKAVFLKAVGVQSSWDNSVLDGADFSGAVLVRASFGGASLKQAKLGSADCKSATFHKAAMLLALADHSDFFEATFEKADLSGVDFSGSNLFGAEFLGAKLEGTKLAGANVQSTKLA